MTRRAKLTAAVTAIAVVLAGYVAVAPSIGLEWPYPQRLPGTFSFAGYDYQRDAGCHPETWWMRVGGRHMPPFTRIGTMTTAVIFGGSTVYDFSGFRAPHTQLFVRTDAGCYVVYSGTDIPL